MKPQKDLVICDKQMAIVEKYEKVILYLYPIIQSMPRKHGIARDMFMACLLGQVRLFIDAGKSTQVSKLYIADAGLADLRFWLRLVNGKLVRSMTNHQCETALVLIAEVGKMLGAWISSTRHKG